MRKQQKEEKKKSIKKRTSAYLKLVTLAVFGEARVGKTSLVRAFLGETFNDDYEPTVEDFYSKQITHKDKNYQVDIIDTCGTENFPAMRKIDINKADGIVLVYSLDNPDSFEKLRQFREEIVQEKGYCLPVTVVANKSDVVLDGRALEITSNEGNRINTKRVTEKEWRCSWTITSAKAGWGVDELFRDLIDAIYTKRSQTMPVKRRGSWLETPLLGSLRRKSK